MVVCVHDALLPYLPVLDTVVDTPPNKLDSVTASERSRLVSVHTASVVLKVGVDGECRLDGTTLHDHLLDGRFAGCSLNLALERVPGRIARSWVVR
jgi:hypothetical protein